MRYRDSACAIGTVHALKGQFVYQENYYNLQYFKSEEGGVRDASRLIVRALKGQCMRYRDSLCTMKTIIIYSISSQRGGESC